MFCVAGGCRRGVYGCFVGEDGPAGGVRWRDDRVLDTIQRSISGESGGKKVFASEIVEQYGWEKNALIWISRHTLTFACHRVIDS